MKNGILKFHTRDFLNGLIVAVLAAVFTQLATVLNAPGFDFAAFNWEETAKISFAATMAYLSKNLLTDNNGDFMGAKV
jgi:hypothetical protein